VSGALNGRSLCGGQLRNLLSPDLGMPLFRNMPMQNVGGGFCQGCRLDHLSLDATFSGALWGAVVGMRIRSSAGTGCLLRTADWTPQAVLSGQTVTLTVPGSGRRLAN